MTEQFTITLSIAPEVVSTTISMSVSIDSSVSVNIASEAFSCAVIDDENIGIADETEVDVYIVFGVAKYKKAYIPSETMDIRIIINGVDVDDYSSYTELDTLIIQIDFYLK